jgi:hypothetical protein
MYLGRSQENMYARAFAESRRLIGGIDIALDRTREAADNRPFDLFSHSLYRVEIALRRHGKTCFDDIYAEIGERLRYLELFGVIQRRAGSLFSVA